jgi:prepilin-type processing-associated H-X9-DG protein
MMDRPAKTSFLPTWIIQAFRWAAIITAVLACLALPQMLRIASYTPRWHFWLSPALLSLAIVFCLLGLIPKSGNRHVIHPLSSLSLALCLLCGGGMLLLPRITVCGEPATRTRCASNLRQLGQALALYRNEYGGANPPDWATLAYGEPVLSLDVWRCPLSNLPELDSNDPAYRAAALIRPRQSSYIYLGQGQTDATPPQTVTAYDRLEDHQGDGTNVLFADGHVEWTTPKGLQAFLDHSGQSP